MGTFNRAYVNGDDLKSVSWRVLRTQSVTYEIQIQASKPNYCIVGSWDNWARPYAMWWQDEECRYIFFIELGDREVHFQLQYDGSARTTCYPHRQGANPHEFHVVKGPDEYHKGLHWTIGKHPKDLRKRGRRYEIRLSIDGEGKPKKVCWLKLPGSTDIAEPRARGIFVDCQVVGASSLAK